MTFYTHYTRQIDFHYHMSFNGLLTFVTSIVTAVVVPVSVVSLSVIVNQ